MDSNGGKNVDECTMKTEIDHIKADIIDIKLNAKEQSKDMLLMRDSHIETKFYIKQIQDSQEKMAKETKENQASMLKGIQEIKDEPIKNFKYYKMVGWAFAITYVLGTIFGIIKAIYPS